MLPGGRRAARPCWTSRQAKAQRAFLDCRKPRLRATPEEQDGIKGALEGIRMNTKHNVHEVFKKKSIMNL